MIITANDSRDSIEKVWVKDQNIKSFHAQKIDEILRWNQISRNDEGNGWTKGRNFRHVARISALGVLEIEKKYPETKAHDPVIRDRAWHKALNDSQFDRYKTVAKGV